MLKIEWLNLTNVSNDQDSPVVSRKAKKKQHAHAQPTQLPVCYLQLPTLWNFQAAILGTTA